MQNPLIVCLDLEGVLVPEIWVNFAIKTGIEEPRSRRAKCLTMTRS